MAIKITADAIVKMIRPKDQHFSLDELNDHVNGWIEPLKVGPVWVVYREKSKENGEPLNQVASFFFDVAIYGTVLVIPPQQMPIEWDLLEPADLQYSSDQVDTGFLSALQGALVYNRVFGATNIVSQNSVIRKQEWSFKPSDAIDEETAEFFNKAYESIVKIRKDNENVLFEDETLVVKTSSTEDKVKTIKQMIDYFVQSEDYEKCAELQKLVKEYNC
jgi:hypothetical protein